MTSAPPTRWPLVGSSSRSRSPMTSVCLPVATCGSRHRARRRATCSSSSTTRPISPQFAVPRAALPPSYSPRSGWAARTTRSSTGCTRRRRWSLAAPWTPPWRSAPARRSTPSTSPAAFITPCRPGLGVLRLQRRRRRHSLATGRRHPEGGVCRRRCPSRRRCGGGLLPRSSGTDHQSARERLHGLPRHRLPRATPAAARRKAPPSTSRSHRTRTTPAGYARSTPWCRRWCGHSNPQILITQLGCDSHRLDPLARSN